MFRMILVFSILFATACLAEEKKNDDQKLVCGKSKDMEKVLNDKGYIHLLDMTSDDIVQSLWIGGKSIIATAQVPGEKDVSCLLKNFTDVTLNPVTITEIYKALQKTQKGI